MLPGRWRPLPPPEGGDGRGGRGRGREKIVAMALPSAPTDALPPDPLAAQASLRRAARQEQAPWWHREAARRMGERLAWIRREPAQVLDASGPWGGSLEVLQAAYPRARLLQLDARPGVQPPSAWAGWRPWGPARPAWLAVSEEGRLPAGQAGGFGMIWSNLALHRQREPESLLRHWAGRLEPEGFLMVSAYGPDSLKELRELHRQAGWAPPAQDFLDMHDLGDAMVRAGLADPVVDSERLNLSWPDAPSLLRELRSWGRNAHPRRAPTVRGRAWAQAYAEALSQGLRGPDGRLHLSLELVQGHAFKGLARAGADGLVKLPVEGLRAGLRRRQGA